jgi:SAM-dependent methyltransferase
VTDRLRRALLAGYHEGQGRISSPGYYADPRAGWPHFDANYAPLLGSARADWTAVDVGCGHGSLIGWLEDRFGIQAEGVDASPGDVAFANAQFERDRVTCADATGFLRERPDAFDLITMKAILEHVPKGELLSFLEAAWQALSPTGILIVEVPNMDWLAAPHERYLDLTHEVGFTRQSLQTLLELGSADVFVKGSALALPTRSQRLLRPLLVAIIRRVLYVLGEGADDVWFASRSLIAVGRSRGGTGIASQGL